MEQVSHSDPSKQSKQNIEKPSHLDPLKQPKQGKALTFKPFKMDKTSIRPHIQTLQNSQNIEKPLDSDPSKQPKQNMKKLSHFPGFKTNSSPSVNKPQSPGA